MTKVALLTAAFISASIPTAAFASNPCPPVATTGQPPSAARVLRLATDWVAMINSADDAAYLRFLDRRGPAPDNGFDPLLMRGFLRGMELCGIKSATADAVELWTFDPNADSFGIWKFRPGATDAEKTKFVAGSFTDEIPPGAAAPARLALPTLIKAVDELAASRAAKDQFSGAILLAEGGRVRFQKAYGLADRARRKPITIDTQFRFGSMGKMFTAVAVMQLVEQGKVDLQAPVGRYLKNYPNQDIATKVTVADLLSHTGGTGDIFGPEFRRAKASLRSSQDYIHLYGNRAPEFAPAARVSYSNYGFILLGRIVETVSGLPYNDYIRRNIFKPAGMTSTGNRPESEFLPRRAVSYTGSSADLKSAADTLPANGTAAGGGYSTVGDFHRFMTALTAHRLLRRATLQQLIGGGVRLADGKLVPYDFGDTVPGAGRWIGHSGGAPGMSGTLEHFLDSGITLVILANRDPTNVKGIANFTEHRLPRH